MLNCKTFYETQKTSRLNKIIQPPPHPPPPPPPKKKSLKQIFSYGDIQKYTIIRFQNASRMHFGRQEMMGCKCFFLPQTETCLLEDL